MIKIIERNPVHSNISDTEFVKGFLWYEKEFWVSGPFRKEKKIRRLSLIDRYGNFYSGFLPNVTNILDKKDIKYKLVSKVVYPESKKPKLKGIKFRKDQKTALHNIIGAKRGYWQAPTGSGKTILIAGVLSSFDINSIVIVHTKSLFDQTVKELKRFFEKDIGQIKSGSISLNKITVAMRQSLGKVLKEKKYIDKFKDYFGVVIVDECHHVSKFDGQLGFILSNLYAPIRIGMTATPPTSPEAIRCLEGLIGNKIGTTSYDSLEKQNVLAKPKLKLIKVPTSDRFKYLKGGYRDVYMKGIVEYRKRNLLVVRAAEKQVKRGLTVLIIVERIQHGEELMKLFKVRLPKVFKFLQGSTNEDTIKKEKDKFESGKRKGIIATRIWCEGVNIKTIGAVVNAAGGDSEIAAIQRFGRGMRTAEGKSKVILIDFLDTNHVWFQKHSINRLCYYSDWKWL